MVTRSPLAIILVLALLAGAHVGCDAAAPPDHALVLEMFAQPGQPLPPLYLHETGPIGEAGGPPIDDAVVVMRMGDAEVSYLNDGPGRYVPRDSRLLAPGDTLDLSVRSGLRTARAATIIPPSLAIDSIRITPRPQAVRAVYADAPGTPTREGYLYPIDVAVFWAPAGEGDWWIRTLLAPPDAAPGVADFVLRMEEILPESDLANEDLGVREWRGLYAVPVDAPDQPLPAHEIELAILRSGIDYALFALSHSNGAQTDPIGNVDGGLGVVAGVAIDRAWRTVAP